MQADLNRTLETCTLGNWPECRATALLTSYFCGYSPECGDPDSAASLALAKNRVAKSYIAVGVLEELPQSLQLYEAELPQFFTGLVRFFKRKMPNANRNSYQNANANVVEELGRRFHQDVELYHFAVAQFHKKLLQSSI